MIQVDSLRKSFGGRLTSRLAVDGLTFSAQDGAITGLVGPNGSGKTTTLRLITGLLRAESGQVRVDGIDPAQDPLGARRRLGALTDGLGNYPRLTTREHLRYFGELRGMPAMELEARTRHLLDLFDMREIADRRAQGFSQGERMKLALARAIINDPPNIILDEPANGLDVASARALRTLLERFRNTGKCVLLSSHLMAEVSAVCDRVVVVARGKVVAQGSPAELVRSRNARSLEEAFVELTA
jgi:sodium transport system ATP-binding protein